MKKLSKLKLSQNADPMNYPEMKMILGGSGGEYTVICSKKSCSKPSDCSSGACVNFLHPGVAGCIGRYCL